jgi:hypothetical protein
VRGNVLTKHRRRKCGKNIAVACWANDRQLGNIRRNPPRFIVNNFAADPAPASYLNTLIGCYSKILITHALQASRTSIALNESLVRRLNAFSGRGIM